MSKQRDKFIAAKKAKRQQRLDDKWWSEHHFWCQGTIQRRGIPQTCMFEVRFYSKGRAQCRRCQQVHVWGSEPGGRERWLTAEQHAELHIPNESLLRVEDVQRVMEVERSVKGDHGYMESVPEKLVYIAHAPWCQSPDVILVGLSAKLEGPGRIVWRNDKGHFAHNCQSKLAGQELANARWS